MPACKMRPRRITVPRHEPLGRLLAAEQRVRRSAPILSNGIALIGSSILDPWHRLRVAVDELAAELERAPAPLPNPRMIEFLIVAEDHRFFRHPGVDPWALCRAAWRTHFCHSREGGSTIAMQLVRTLTGRREHSWRRKALEIVLAWRLSRYVSRDRLPALYLWCAYYGWRMSNFRDACARLGLDPTSTTALDDALLIARLKYPEPKHHDHMRMRKIRRRAAHILSLVESFPRHLYAPSLARPSRL